MRLVLLQGREVLPHRVGPLYRRGSGAQEVLGRDGAGGILEEKEEDERRRQAQGKAQWSGEAGGWSEPG